MQATIRQEGLIGKVKSDRATPVTADFEAPVRDNNTMVTQSSVTQDGNFLS